MKINLKRFLIALALIIFLSFSLGFITGQTFNKEPNDKNEQDVPEINRNIYTGSEIDKGDSDSISPAAEPVIEEETEWMVFEATAYCPCEKCCGKWAKNRPSGVVYTASGEVAEEGITIAADWSVLPKGTVVEIDGVGTRIVQDKGGAIKGNRIDIYFQSHHEALEYGRQTVRLREVGN